MLNTDPPRERGERALTRRQERVLAFIKDSCEKNGFPPTVREIARHLRLRGPKGAQKHLAALEGKGYIRRRSRLSRAMEVVGWSGESASPTVVVPLVGRVRAGAPLLATEEAEQHLRLDRSLAPPGSFVLRVTGDSMIEAGIHSGDLAVVRPHPQPRNGEIVVALVNDEATVKRFYKDRHAIRLEPANARMNAIVVKPDQEEVRVLGKVVAIIRKL
ncbi:MAG TPA: transcriptional repressor LexA [Nitrospiria bacterium]|nr:transcriptional repressor LexA [Nitrospiria bacterium]